MARPVTTIVPLRVLSSRSRVLPSLMVIHFVCQLPSICFCFVFRPFLLRWCGGAMLWREGGLLFVWCTSAMGWCCCLSLASPRPSLGPQYLEVGLRLWYAMRNAMAANRVPAVPRRLGTIFGASWVHGVLSPVAPLLLWSAAMYICYCLSSSWTE